MGIALKMDESINDDVKIKWQYFQNNLNQFNKLKIPWHLILPE